MLNAAKRGDSGAHLLRSAPGNHSHTYGGENVLEVVRALQLNVAHGHDRRLDSVGAEDNLPFLNESPVFHGLLTAEPIDRGPEPGLQFHAGGVIGIEQSEIAGLLVLEDSRLGIHIDLESAMPVEMVGSDIENRGHPRPELFHGFKLKAG